MKNLGICCALLMFVFFSCGDSNEKKEEKRQNQEEVISSDKKKDEATKTILFFGNSLTAGLGLESDETFPALIQEKIDSLNLDYRVINAGLSGETTAAGKNRINWVLKQNVDVFVLELGANDGLRGIALEETRENLQAIIDIVREKNPETEIILAGMQIPPNMGQEYTSEFRNIFPELAEKNNVHIIPFLLENVAGKPELNQQDGIHPTAEGQEIVAKNVWEILAPIVKEENYQE
ncbi:arylesterase [Zunongwangia sp. F363]|uniref:Arylesterase n=1 Tax=Autumnicola tepida TaxID=3075595 RepID=A0ABU3CDA1_9FLAO|nr:arylesterase [Zunongwangia sp. F363]MDT0644318.1 arylesterase [Zunongwangia sp. F363]